MAEICLYECLREIRDLINKPRKRFQLLKNLGGWDQMCSSLDVIEDTDLALSAYLEAEFPREDGAKYLAVYGVLQALFVQQYAVMHLCESLNVPRPSSDPILEQIRDVRNESIGHPTKKDKSKSRPISYHFISRATISKKRFQLLSSYGDGRTEFKDVLIEKMIADQKDKLKHVLDDIIDKLVQEEIEHKERPAFNQQVQHLRP